MYAHDAYVMRALRNGATGYVLKDATPAELEHAVRTVAQGETYLSPAVLTPVVTAFQRRMRRGEIVAEEETLLAAPLTPRQREILQLIAESYTTKEIGLMLNLKVS